MCDTEYTSQEGGRDRFELPFPKLFTRFPFYQFMGLVYTSRSPKLPTASLFVHG